MGIRERSLKAVKYLMYKGADITIKNIVGFNALILASFRGNLEIIKYLISKGSVVDDKDNSGVQSLLGFWQALNYGRDSDQY